MDVVGVEDVVLVDEPEGLVVVDGVDVADDDPDGAADPDDDCPLVEGELLELVEVPPELEDPEEL